MAPKSLIVLYIIAFTMEASGSNTSEECIYSTLGNPKNLSFEEISQDEILCNFSSCFL